MTLRGLALALLCASQASALSPPDSTSPPGKVDTKPKLQTEPQLPPRLGAVSAAGLGLAKLSPLKCIAIVRPYLKNPMAVPKRVLAFVGLMLFSFYMLLSALTSIASLMLRPQSNLMSLCMSSASFHAGLFALKGPQAQLEWLTTPDRLPFSMLSLLSFVVAFREATGAHSPRLTHSRLSAPQPSPIP